MALCPRCRLRRCPPSTWRRKRPTDNRPRRTPCTQTASTRPSPAVRPPQSDPPNYPEKLDPHLRSSCPFQTTPSWYRRCRWRRRVCPTGKPPFSTPPTPACSPTPASVSSAPQSRVSLLPPYRHVETTRLLFPNGPTFDRSQCVVKI